MPDPKHSFADVLKNGFVWMMVFTAIFFLFCKWFSGH